MSLKDCIRANQERGEITLEEAQALERRYNALARRVLSKGAAREQLIAELEAEATERQRRAVLTETARQARERDVFGHRNAAGHADPAEALAWVLEHQGQAKFQSAAQRQKALQGLYQSHLERLLREFRGKMRVTGDVGRRFGRTAARLDNVVREAFGQGTGDAAAKDFARAWSEVAEDLRQAFNAAGGAIGKLQQWGLPQHHSADALRRVGMERWVREITPRLDREKMRHPLTGEAMTDDELRDSLEYVWETITTGGASRRQPSGAQFGQGALFNRHSDHRFLIFKDADNWLAYQKDFGEGDAFAAMMGHISTMTRDLALMERLGPNPAAMMEYLKQAVEIRAARMRPNNIIRAEQIEAANRAAQLAPEWRSAEARRLLGEAGQLMGRPIGDMDVAQIRGYRRAARAARALVDAMRADRTFSEADAREFFQLVHGDGVGLGNPDAWLRTGLFAGTTRDQMLDALAMRLDTTVEALDVFEADARRAPNERGGDEAAELRALLETMEPQQAARIRARVDQIRGEIVAYGADPQARVRSWARTAGIMFDHMRGSANIAVDPTLASVGQGLRNLVTASSLGSAVVSALSDASFQHAARRMAGLPHRRVVSSYAKALAPGGQQKAVRAGLILDSALHVMHRDARHAAGTNFSGATGYIADRTLALTLLSPFTQGGKHGFGLDMTAYFADLIEDGVDWDGLTPEWRGLLERNEFTPADWDRLRQIAPTPEGFLDPRSVELVDRDLALKYLGAIHLFTTMAVPEPTHRARAAMVGRSEPGTVQGELQRMVLQFKGFSVGILFLHGMATYREVVAGNYGSAAANASGLIVSMTLLGGVAMQIKELINGRDPRSVDNPAFWGAAFMQGGGLGIYGDLLFADVNRFGGGLTSTMAGPVIGRLDNLRNLTIGNISDLASDKDTNFGRELVRFARQNTPLLSSAWYTRLVWNNMLMDSLQRMADPQAHRAFRRQIQNRQRDYGQRYWWEPGRGAPSRAPDAGALLSR